MIYIYVCAESYQIMFRDIQNPGLLACMTVNTKTTVSEHLNRQKTLYARTSTLDPNQTFPISRTYKITHVGPLHRK